jgi:stearoyl-CoA desaturase (delta-9 desaturase)
MRFWLWLTTGMVTRQWVAIHRKHHQCTDEEGDPHSPLVYGIRNVLFKGALLYHSASKDKEMIEKYTPDIEDDWIERNLYTPHSRLGILIMAIIDLVLFGPWGFVIWGVQMLWIPFWAAGVVNGIGHWWGYRNHETRDNSRNIFPVGLIIGGEELHNNHHRRPADAKLSHKFWEIDIGYSWLRLFRMLGLAKLR